MTLSFGLFVILVPNVLAIFVPKLSVSRIYSPMLKMCIKAIPPIVAVCFFRQHQGFCSHFTFIFNLPFLVPNVPTKYHFGPQNVDKLIIARKKEYQGCIYNIWSTYSSLQKTTIAEPRLLFTFPPTTVNENLALLYSFDISNGKRLMKPIEVKY